MRAWVDADELDTGSGVDVPPRTRVYELDGPLFFGVADKLTTHLTTADCRCIILRMRSVKPLTERQTDALDEIERRLQKAEEEVKHYHNYDYVIINDDFYEAVKELEAIILAEQCLPRRVCVIDEQGQECSSDDESLM